MPVPQILTKILARRSLALLGGGAAVGAVSSAWADMFQDASNADKPQAQHNLGIPYDTVASLQAATIPAAIVVVQTRGHTRIGLGGAIYIQSVGPAAAGKVQSADGRWWALSYNQPLCPTMFGAIADGTSANAAADLQGLNNLAAYIRAAPSDGTKFVGRKVNVVFTPGLSFYLTGTVNWTSMSVINLVIDCSGAQINLHGPGLVGIDMLGTNSIKISDLLIRGDEVNSPRIGLQHGRYNAAGQENNVFSGVQILGRFTRAGLLNSASETTQYQACTFRNYDSTPGTPSSGSYAWIVDAWNNENVTSSFVTVINGVRQPLSCANVEFDKYWGAKTYNVASQLGRGAEGLITGGVGAAGATVKNFKMRSAYGNVFGGPNIEVEGDLINALFEKHGETQAPANADPPWGTGPTYAIRSISSGAVSWMGFKFQENNSHAWVAAIGKEGPGALYITMGDIEVESMQHQERATVFAAPLVTIDDPVTGTPTAWTNGPIHYSGALRLGLGNAGDAYALRDLRELASLNGTVYTAAPANSVLMPTSGVGGAQVFGQRVPGSTSGGAARNWGSAALRPTGQNYLANPDFSAAAGGAGPFTVDGTTLDSWTLLNGTGAVNAIQRVAGTFDATYAVAWDRTTAGSTASFFRQLIPDLRRFAGQQVILSFDLWAAVAGTVNIGAGLQQTFGTGGSPSGAVTVTTQNFTIGTTVQRYEMLFVVPSVAGKTFGSNNDDGLSCRFQRTQLQEDGVVYIQNVKLEVASRPTAFGATDPAQDAPWQTLYLGGEARVSSTLGNLALGPKAAAFAAIYGTGSITDFGLNPNQMMRCRAEAACTITYNAASLIVPGAANITTAAGDSWWVRADQDGVERVFGYERNVAP